MKAWLLDNLTGLDHLRLTDVPDPIPADGELLVDLEFAALNPADRYLSQGQYPAQPKLPHVLGRDGVGIIGAVGKNAGPFRVGQRVLIIRGETGVNRWGTFAQRVAVSAQAVAIPPAGWSVRQSAGAALVYLTAHQALTQWGDLPPSIVLVTGASGGVGVATIQLAKALGHTVVALSRDAGKREKLKQFGADHALDPSDPHWPANLKASLSPRRVDLAIDNVGGAQFNQVIEALGPFARVSVVGQLAGPVPQFSTASLFFRRIRIGGVALGTFTPAEAMAAWESSVALLARIGAKPIVDRVFAFEELPAAFDRLAAGPLGKVLVQIRNDDRDPLV
ncbi:MAG: zinc-binding dehydrogenase [Tepidisphaeraceae bacterium]|jgi:NADPH:quinone reductase